MNYVIVVIGFVCFLASINWLIDGRHRFYGPANVMKHLEKNERAVVDTAGRKTEKD